MNSLAKFDGQPGPGYVLERLKKIFRCPVAVFEAPGSIDFQRDLEVPMRDGTILRANLFRPARSGRLPVLISFHPYGKDNLPKKALGRHWPLMTFRMLRQTASYSVSSYTGWEAPDPAVWTKYGYAVLNADMRGFHRSEGKAHLLTEQEGLDYYDLIEWAAKQDWCDGSVGLSGVSYLAITQWRAASLRPPSLKAICPWEGFTDAYHDLAYPGGVREQGFTNFWFGHLDQRRLLESLPKEQDRHPQYDDYWQAKVPKLEDIEVPILTCGSFSDHNLHSGGSFRGFERAGSKQKWLYTHRDGKWAAYYSEEAVKWQKRFFDHFLKGEDNGMDTVPPVRLEVRESRDRVVEVRPEAHWPLERTEWTTLYLHADGTLSTREPTGESRLQASFPEDSLSFSYTFECDTEITGPMQLRLKVHTAEGENLRLFAGIRKLRDGRHVVFEGSYGFGCDLVTRGWKKLPTVTDQGPACVELELLPSSTLFRAGDTLRLDLQGRYFFKKHPLLGQFPAGYEESPQGKLVLHCFGEDCSRLLVPVIPGRDRPEQ